MAVSGCLIKLSSVLSISCGLSDAQSVSWSDGGSVSQLVLGFWWFSLSLPVASRQAAGDLLAYPLVSVRAKGEKPEVGPSSGAEIFQALISEMT